MAVCSCANITHQGWKWKKPADPKTVDKIKLTTGPFNPATVLDAYNGIVDTQNKEHACSLRKTLKEVIKDANWVRIDATQKRRAEKLRNLLCDIIGINCACADKLNSANTACYDPDVVQEKADCATKDQTKYEWRSCKCRKKQKGKAKPKIIEPPAGCLDPLAINYICLATEQPKLCVDGKPPANTKGIPCEYKKEYTIENTYLFCNKEFCTNADTLDIARVTPTNNSVIYENDGSLPKGYIDTLKNGVKIVIQKANNGKKFLFLADGVGFYIPEKWPDALVDEFASAFAIVIFRTWFAGNQTFPYNFVTIQSRDAKLLGLFKIQPVSDRNGEEDSINKIVGTENSISLQYRLKFRVGYKLHQKLIPSKQRMKNILDNMSGVDYTINLDDATIIKESEVGLINLLKEEPIGLAKLLK